MTPDDEKIMELTIKVAVNQMIDRMLPEIDNRIAQHKSSCRFSQPIAPAFTFSQMFKEGKAIIVSIIVMAGMVSGLISWLSSPENINQKFSVEQIKQVAKEVIEIEKLTEPK